MKCSRWFAVAALAVAFGAASSRATDMAYLSVKAQKQGVIKGEATTRGHEDQMVVTAWSYEVVSPRDPQSGLPTGQRMHKPVTVTLEIDKATPLLFQACVSNELLNTVRLDLLRPTANGVTQDSFRVTLTNANIADIHFVSPETQGTSASKGAASGNATRVEISFTFQKLQIEDLAGKTSSQDDWSSRSGGSGGSGPRPG